MAEWLYLIHPPREDFAATMTEAEEDAWGRHWERIRRLYDEGTVILVGPTLGSTNTGICVFEAPDEAAALEIMNGDPTIAEGVRPRRSPPDACLAAPRPRRGPGPRRPGGPGVLTASPTGPRRGDHRPPEPAPPALRSRGDVGHPSGCAHRTES